MVYKLTKVYSNEKCALTPPCTLLFNKTKRLTTSLSTIASSMYQNQIMKQRLRKTKPKKIKDDKYRILIRLLELQTIRRYTERRMEKLKNKKIEWKKNGITQTRLVLEIWTSSYVLCSNQTSNPKKSEAISKLATPT